MIETILKRDMGTPPKVSTQMVTLEIDGVEVTRAGRHFGDARSSREQYQHPEAVRDRQPGTFRFLPFVPGGN